MAGDGFTLLHNGLDRLMHMMVNVLARNLRHGRASVMFLLADRLILELGGFFLQPLLHLALIAMLELAVLDAGEIVVVFLRKHFALLDGLDCCMVVILMDLLVDGCSHIFVLRRLDRLVGDGGLNPFVDGGIMVSGLGHKVRNGGLSFLHCQVDR